MPQKEKRSLTDWMNFLSKVDIPVLKQTIRNISDLHQDGQHVNAKNIAHIIKNDPLMTVKLLRYLQQHKHRSQEHEIMEVDQVIMMIGMEVTLEEIVAKPLVEEVLDRENMSALVQLLKVSHRANLASAYAFDWAVRLHDLHFEEVRIAALLHDITEILMWCFAPKEMLAIKAIQKQDKSIRSTVAQEKILGFTIHQLQLDLAIKWKLPELLITLMDDDCANQQRVRNVILAVNLARHSANGWDDAALPDDYDEIGRLLHLNSDDIKTIVGANKYHADKEYC